MTDNEKKGTEQNPIEEPISTIFSAPEEKTDVVKHKNPKKIIAILLCACIIIASGAVAAITLIPKKPDDDGGESSLSFGVVENKLEDVEKIDLKNKTEEITFLSTVESLEADGGDEKVTTWGIDGIDNRLIDSAKVEDSVFYCATIYAIKEVKGDAKDYGLDNPYAEFTVYPRGDAFTQYTVKVGNESGDKIGRYLSIEGDDAIYLVENTYSDEYSKVKTDFATSNAVKPIEKTDNIKSYFEDDTLATCDKIILSGANYSPEITFVPNNYEETKTYSTYLITSPVKRYADGVDALLNIAANGLVGKGAYVFNPTDAEITAYGLDNPLCRLQIFVGGVTYDIKIAPSPVEGHDDYYCVVDQNKEAIFMVSTSSLTFAAGSPEDFYSKFLTMEMLNSISNFNVTMGGKDYNYAIKFNENKDDDSAYNITLNRTNGITQEYFQNYYMYFLSLEVVEYTTYDISATVPVWKAVIKHTDRSAKDTVFAVYKINDQRYQVNVNGDPMGLITSSAYKKLIKYSEAVSVNTDLE